MAANCGSEYVGNIIRKDKDRAEATHFERLTAELAVAFAAPDDSYSALTAHEVIVRNSARK
jgi:antitoxin ParD1/3/4